MSYTNAVYYVDLESGSNTARADLVPTAYANNGSGLVRVTCNSTAAYSTGAVFVIAGTTSAVYDGSWIVTIVDGTHVDLQASTYSVNPAAKGTMTPNGGSSKADALLTLANVAAKMVAGDICRVKATAGPTSVGNATWTNGPIGVAFTPTSSTNATPIVFTKSGHGLVTGDTVVITGHTTNTNANGTWTVTVSGNDFTLLNADGTNSVGNGVGGATGTVRKITNAVVTLASACTKCIACFGNQNSAGKTNWTASANVTCTVSSSTGKEGYGGQQIALASGFTTGKAAYFATGTLNLSGYQQVSFWIYQSAGTVAIAGDVSLRLCTDTAGGTSVHTVAIPAMLALNLMTCVTIDLATNLNSAIASIAFYVDTDRGAQTFLVDNIIAVKAASSNDSLSLTNLIGKNTGTETWYGIQSINNVRVILDNGTNTVPISGISQRGYTGTTETVTTYKRETLKNSVASGNALVHPGPNGSSASALIQYLFGWDRTNMSTQDSLTVLDGRNGAGVGFAINSSRLFTKIDKLCLVRYANGISHTSTSHDNIISGLHSNNHTNASISLTSGLRNTYTVAAANNNSGIGVNFNDAGSGVLTYGNTLTVTDCSGNYGSGVFFGGINSCTIISIDRANNNYDPGLWLSSGNLPCCHHITCGAVSTSGSGGNSGVVIGGHECRFGTVVSTNNAVAGLTFVNANAATANNIVGTLVTSGNTTRAVTNQGHNNVIRSATMAEATTVAGELSTRNDKCYVTALDGVVGAAKVFMEGGSITAQTSVTYSGSGRAWQFSVTSTTVRGVYSPVSTEIMRLAVGAGTLVTVTAHMRRSNTGLTFGLRLRGRQIGGVDSDVTSEMTAAADTWELVTLTFTPTEAGVVELEAYAYGGTTYSGYLDDMSASQA